MAVADWFLQLETAWQLDMPGSCMAVWMPTGRQCLRFPQTDSASLLRGLLCLNFRVGR